jgi:hypothetical protein
MHDKGLADGSLIPTSTACHHLLLLLLLLRKLKQGPHHTPAMWICVE